MALQAIWLSDIFMGSGQESTQCSWEGKVDNNSQYQWPQCAPTGPADWQFWWITLQQCLQLDWWNKLQCPLGLWFPGQVGWYYQGAADRLWQKMINHWLFYPTIPR